MPHIFSYCHFAIGYADVDVISSQVSLIVACECTFASKTEYCIHEAHARFQKQHLPWKRGKEQQVQDLLSQIVSQQETRDNAKTTRALLLIESRYRVLKKLDMFTTINFSRQFVCSQHVNNTVLLLTQ
jgi:hypothetical protein